MDPAWGSCDENEQIQAGKAHHVCEEPRAAIVVEWGQTHPEKTHTNWEDRDHGAERSAPSTRMVGRYKCFLDN